MITMLPYPFQSMIVIAYLVLFCLYPSNKFKHLVFLHITPHISKVVHKHTYILPTIVHFLFEQLYERYDIL